MRSPLIMRLSLLGPLAFGLGLLLLVGCGSPTNSPPAKAQSFVGMVASSNAFITLVAAPSGKSVAYVCDNTSIAEWFQGTASQQHLDLTSSGCAHLQASFVTNQVTGTVTFGGQAHTFSATPATGQAGLYRATATIQGQTYVGGWIVLQDNRVEGQVPQGRTSVDASPFHPSGSIILASRGTLFPQFINPDVDL